MDASPFIKHSGMTVTAIDKTAETLTMTMPLKPEFERAPGTGQFHGGPIAALIDTAGCFGLIRQHMICYTPEIGISHTRAASCCSALNLFLSIAAQKI